MKAGHRLSRTAAFREVVAVGTLLVFVGLLGWERATGAFAFDLPVLHAVHSVSQPAIVEASRWLAWAGYGYGVLPVDGLIVLALLAMRRMRDAAFAFGALWGGLLLNTGLKHAIQRARPGLDTVREVQLSYSFPSGHAMASAALAATLVTLAWHTRWRWPVVVVSSLFALLVGIGRVHAGVHYPTDVAAGWAIGVAWVCVVHIVIFRPAIGPASAPQD